MTKVFWFLLTIILCGLLHKSNAGPDMLNKNYIHYTNIGDISPKDILRLADEATPADKRFVSPAERLEDPAENNMETERNVYYNENDSPDLDSPKDQERKLVQILKKHYKGTFPEYGKETEADFGGNRELEDNMNVQPETVSLGHSDMYHGKRRGNEDTGDFEAPEDDPSFENLDTFDGDSNLLSPDSQDMDDFHAEINNSTTPPSHTTVRHHTSQPAMYGNEYDNAENDDLGVEDDGGASGTIGDEDTSLGTDNEQEEANKVAEKPQKTEDRMQDLPTEAEDMLHDKKKKKEKKEKKVKLNKDDNSGGILDEFDDLQKGGMSKQITNKITSKTPSLKHQTGNKISGKKINYIHTDDSLATSDAILDFLDKLLQKDPKSLRHDVLTMAKEMKNEENILHAHAGRTVSPVKENHDQSHASRPRNTKQRVKLKNGRLLKNNADDGHEVDKWISEMEGEKDDEKEANAAMNQAESFDNEEYNEYHELPDIYPDHNDGEMTTLTEPVRYDAALDDQGARPGSKERENDKEELKVKKLERAEFDYEEFKEESLKMHNEFRRRHNAVALEWSENLAKKAHDVAKQLTSATRNNFKRQLEKRGQSIAILPYTTKDIAKSAVQKWYSEITTFSFANPDIKAETRDFTQIIWSGSKRLGMGFAHSANKKKTLVVALYSPAGNNRKEMRRNLNMVNYDLYADIRKAVIERFG